MILPKLHRYNRRIRFAVTNDQNIDGVRLFTLNPVCRLALDIYNTFYGKIGREGVGQAKAVIFFIIVAAISFAQLIYTRNKEVEQ